MEIPVQEFQFRLQQLEKGVDSWSLHEIKYIKTTHSPSQKKIQGIVSIERDSAYLLRASTVLARTTAYICKVLALC